MSEENILNPLFPFTAFPLNPKQGTIAFGLVYQGNDNEILDLDVLCAKCKTELHLDYLEPFYSCGRDGLNIRKSDIMRIYEIVSWFLRNGRRIYMQDATQVTFSLTDSNQVNLIRQQEILLDSCRQLLQYGLPLTLVNLPIHRSAFWKLEKGKQFAQELRNQRNLSDSYPLPEEGMCIGELLQWQSEQKISEKKDDNPHIDEKTNDAKEEPQEEDDALLCVVCLNKKANTFCIPCEHCVVCLECSIALRSDEINKRICVYCRQPIEHILE